MPLVGIAFADIPGFRIKHRVTPHHDAGSSEEPQRTSAAAGISGYRVKARYDVAVTPHYDAGSRKVPLVGIAFAGIYGFRIKCGMTGRRGPARESPRTAMRGPLSGIPGYRVEHRVTPHYDAGSRKVPLAGIAFADISGFRIKCGMTGRVFLDTAVHRVTPHSDAGSSV